MLRSALAVVLVVLVLGVTALGVGGWQISQTMNELGDTLATMNETQRALLASREREDRPLAIRGRLYLGDKSKPASYAAVDVYGLGVGSRKDGLITQLTADEDGRFVTESLQPGNYSLVAKLLPRNEDPAIPAHLVPDFYLIQSRPISVYPWSKNEEVELNVEMIDFGFVSFELTKPFPRMIEIDTSNAHSLKLFPQLYVTIPVGPQMETLPVTNLARIREIKWPLIGTKQGSSQLSDYRITNEVVFEGDRLKPASDKPLPIGEPVLFRRVATGEPHFRPGNVSVSAYITIDHAGSGESAGEIEPGYALIGEGNMTTLPVESRATIEVIAGRRTHLRITPPADLEKTLREDIGKALGDEKKLTTEIRKARPVKLEVVGQQGLVPEDHLGDQAASLSTQRFAGGFAN